MQKAYIFICDLHIGGLMDFKALDILVIRLQLILQMLKPIERSLIFLGDIIEGNEIHEYQDLVAHPIQKAKYASYVIKWIVDELAVDEVVIMPGNSDLYVYKDRAIVLVIKEELEKFSINVKVVNEGHIIDIGEKKVMLCNTIGETPWRLVGGLVPEILGLGPLYAREYGVDTIVCGHYHVFAMSPELILLPSFQWSDNPMYWARGGLMMTDEGLIIPIVYKQMTDYSNPDAIDELENWLHSIKQRVLISGRNEKVRFCIDYEGYRRSRWLPRELYEKIRLMLEAGVPVKVIARKLGLSPTTIRFVKYGYEC